MLMQKIKSIAIVGSRSLSMDISRFVSSNVSRIITGGACGIDSSAIIFAKKNGIPVVVLRPDYNKFDKIAPFIRNRTIVGLCDSLIAIWDGKSSGTRNVISLSIKSKKPTTVFTIRKNNILKEIYNLSEQIRFF